MSSSLAGLLSLLAPSFTQPTFQTFSMLVVGMVGRVRDCTVTGMLQAAGLTGEWPHSRVHDFFARRRWEPDELGVRLLDFLVTVFVSRRARSGSVDDTLFVRSGRKVFGAHYLHDGAQPEGSGQRTRWGTAGSWSCSSSSFRVLAAGRLFTPVTANTPGGRERTAHIHAFTCLWYGPLRSLAVKVILIRNPGTSEGFDTARASTDTTATATILIARYDSRRTIETAHQEAKAHGVVADDAVATVAVGAKATEQTVAGQAHRGEVHPRRRVGRREMRRGEATAAVRRQRRTTRPASGVASPGRAAAGDPARSCTATPRRSPRG
jgi:hypothetical protein